MLDQKARRKTQRLGLDVEVQIVAKTLPGFRTEIAAVGLRRTEDTEFHLDFPGWQFRGWRDVNVLA
jgi:hypothetical protein